MAFHYSPKIVTDGLVLYLDAANTKSFTIGSTLWNDLTRNKYSGTLLSGATFSSLNGGGVVFDGIDDSVSISNVESVLSATGSGTIDFVYKLNSVPAAPDFRNVWAFAGLLFQYENNAGFMRFVWRYTDSTYNGCTTRISETDLKTYHITCAYTTSVGSSTFKVYKNGLLEDTQTYTKALTTTVKSPISFGGVGSTNCTIFSFKVYNRELSSTEVFQNFKATKTRFGI